MGTELRQKFNSFLASNWFFGVILLLFAAEAMWLAVTNRYPMAFDESYHFSLIQFFSHRINPIVTSESSSSYPLGAIAHNPSFLYHYLLSFPYRLIAHLTSDMKTQVIALRFINIIFALSSLYVIRETLRLMGLKAAWASVIVFLFAFTPIFSVLSAQINYDNLLILTTSLTVYLLLSLIKTSQHTQTVDVPKVLTLLCLCLFASEVKYAFLPVFVGVCGCLVWLGARTYRLNKPKFWSRLRAGYHAMSNSRKITFAAIGLLGLGLFGVSYGVNVVRYHNPVPQCNQVLSIQACEHYYSWNRNYQLSLHKTPGPKLGVASYSLLWAKTAGYQLFAEIIPTGGLVPIAQAYLVILVILAAIALVCTLTQIRQLFATFKTLLPLLAVVVCYICFLWARNYHDYVRLGQPVAIQGRYLLPVLVYVYVVLCLGVILTCKRYRLFRAVFMPLTVGLLLTFIIFGGSVGYVRHVSPHFGWVATKAHAPKATALSSSKKQVALRQQGKPVISYDILV